ncbi:hypothetical protein GCM10009772_31720 [Pseudonocardia alni subsp. carboxydivorans]
MENETDEHRGRQVGAQQRLPGVGHGAGRAELAPRCAHDRNGMTTTLAATSTVPTVEQSASAAPDRPRSASTVT